MLIESARNIPYLALTELFDKLPSSKLNVPLVSGAWAGGREGCVVKGFLYFLLSQ